TFPATGTYYILLESYDNDENGSYEIKIYSIDVDGNESNDVFGDATPLTVNASSDSNTIDKLSDIDYFSFSVDTIGVEYVINPGINCDFNQQVWLYDTDGTTSLVNGQDINNGTDPESYFGSETITYTFSATGTYFLRVQSLGNYYSGSYDVQITKP
ncbi:MAG: hypothetical protein GY756_19565, partial [bacterium]|nr:hypothetical protein [bacterium]